jgi:hypothetical protein
LNDKELEEQFSIKKDIESFLGFKDECLSSLENLVEKNSSPQEITENILGSHTQVKTPVRSHLNAFDGPELNVTSEALLKDDIAISSETAEIDFRQTYQRDAPSIIRKTIGRVRSFTKSLF